MSDMYFEPKPTGSNILSAPLMKTGQTVSLSLYDDGYYQHGRDSSFFFLPGFATDWHFGHIYRFTGITGGYYDHLTRKYKDKDGNITTYTLAFPNNHVLDWSQFNPVNNTIKHYYNVLQTNTFTTLSASAPTLTLGGFTGWTYPNWNEAFALWFWGSQTIANSYISYPPFNLPSFTNIITNTRVSNGDLAIISTSNLVGKTTDGTSGTTMLVRTTNISEL